MHEISAAVKRSTLVLKRVPRIGLQPNSPARVSWTGGTRTVATHPGGRQVVTDLATTFGGSGDDVSPGWLFRAAIASCAATSIVLAAAQEDVEIIALDVHVTSSSDARGLLGVLDANGQPVYAGPCDVQTAIHVSARNIALDRLHALVDEALCRSPIPNALPNVTPMSLSVHADIE